MSTVGGRHRAVLEDRVGNLFSLPITRATRSPFVESSQTKGIERTSALGDEIREALETLSEVCVAQRRTESKVTRCAKGLTRDDRDLIVSRRISASSADDCGHSSAEGAT